ncbi:hypothetical protein FHR62_000301 [Xanthomonas arboricola]|nr:hypothetical protein [Xanthomonas arboricola]
MGAIKKRRASVDGRWCAFWFGTPIPAADCAATLAYSRRRLAPVNAERATRRLQPRRNAAKALPAQPAKPETPAHPAGRSARGAAAAPICHKPWRQWTGAAANANSHAAPRFLSLLAQRHASATP